MKRILVACEESGVVREEFRKRGWDAWSCDLLPTAIPGQHIHGDVMSVLNESWDMVIAFPPCTDLCVSGARWFPAKRADGSQQASIDFFMRFTNLECAWAIENPVGIMSTHYCKPDQVIQPWMFGHGETKATCLWLHRLPKLVPTDVVEGRENRIWKMGPSPDRAKERSKTFLGVAKSMANQWGSL